MPLELYTVNIPIFSRFRGHVRSMERMCEYEMRVILSLDSRFLLLILWSQPFFTKKKILKLKKKKQFTSRLIRIAFPLTPPTRCFLQAT